MADTKISALTALADSDVEHTADSIPIVDNSVTTTKRILVSELAQALEVLSTEQASTSGTSIDFTSIPAWVKRITVMLDGVSTNGTSLIQVQIGDSGGVEATSYVSASGATDTGGTPQSSTTGFLVHYSITAATAITGALTLTLMDATNNTWIASGTTNRDSATAVAFNAGKKSLSATLDRVRVTTVNGTDTFDAGAINIMYE